MLTLFGALRYERAHYHCKKCAAGFLPLDAALGIGRRGLSRGATELLCLDAVGSGSFARAARDLRRRSGLHFPEATLRRVAEEEGQKLGDRLEAGETFGAEQPWHWERDAEGHSVAYLSADGTGIGMQGPGGAQAEGRMPYVGMIYNPDPRRPDDPDDDGLADDARNQGKGKSKGKGTSTGKSRNQNQGIDQRRRPDGQVRYLAGLMGLPALGQALRAQARQVGVAAADVIVALTDGAPCLAELFRTNFPLAILILDFWHAAEHLADFSKLLHPHDPAAAAAWFQELRHALRHEGGLPVLGRLLNLDMQHHAEAAREAHRLLLGYLDGNVYRMDYPAYRAKGWRIGSGPVEAACKSVVNARLCLVGMRWREPGADGLCHLRALYRSELSQWADYWNPPVAAVAA